VLVVPDAADEADVRPEPRGRDGLVRALPGRGSRSVNATRSRFALPTTVILGPATRDSLPGAPGGGVG
jgi:hypothetical protein